VQQREQVWCPRGSQSRLNVSYREKTSTPGRTLSVASSILEMECSESFPTPDEARKGFNKHLEVSSKSIQYSYFRRDLVSAYQFVYASNMRRFFWQYWVFFFR
jgi:hypothetical protein